MDAASIVLCAITESCVNSLPYGDSVRWPVRIVVFGSYGLPAVWLDGAMAGVWFLTTAIIGSAVFAASRRWNRVHHLIFEVTTGLVQGSVLVVAYLR